LKKRLPIIVLIVSELIIIYLIWQFWTPASVTLQATDDLRIAVWMGVTWSMDSHTDSELQALTQELTAQGVDDAYVYVSYLHSDDTFNPTYDEAQSFLSRMREYAPEIRWFAWIGVPIKSDERDNRLEDENIRNQIADFASTMITESGFDGIHLNAELIPDSDVSFLQTLLAIREQIPATAILSTTTHAIRPSQPVAGLPYPHVAHHWTIDYLQEVATLTDQVAIMAYDSALPFPRAYREWMRYQVEESARALSGIETELIIGLPVSEEWTWSHPTQSETLANAIYGFNQGYSTRIDGIALYPYWEITGDEWILVNP